MTKQRERFIEFDALKALALLLILYTHSRAYILKIPFLEWYRLGGMYTGLGLFVFLSGYGLQHSAFSFGQERFNIIRFIQKRLMRIYPLYLVALITYLIVFHYFNIYHSGKGWGFSLFSEYFVFHLFSLQAILYPYSSAINTLWFIGMIIPYYLFFALTAQKKIGQFIIINTAIFIVLLSFRIFFNIVDLRLFLYYPVFILGCLCARKKVVLLVQSNESVIPIWTFGLLTLGIYFLIKYFGIPEVPKSEISSFKHLVSFGFVFIYILTSISFLLFAIFKYSWKLDQWQRYISYLSSLSYSAYLFHRVVYALFYDLLLNKLNLSKATGTLLFPVVTIMLLIVAALLSYLEAMVLKSWAKKASA